MICYGARAIVVTRALFEEYICASLLPEARVLRAVIAIIAKGEVNSFLQRRLILLAVTVVINTIADFRAW